MSISHSVRIEVRTGRSEVSTVIAFRVAEALDASLYDVLADTVLPKGACPHCGKAIDT